MYQKYDEELGTLFFVIPAQAGIHVRAFGPTPPLDARLRGHDGSLLAREIFSKLLIHPTSSALKTPPHASRA